MAGSGSYSYVYDVFISFRGEDTRLGFTGFLYKTLSEKGFHTFIDHHADAGRGTTKTLVDAIEESRIGIVVFSENYASSTWCLDELAYIIDSFSNKKNFRRSVFPVFYNVDPSHVRHQSGIYGQALDSHQKNNNFNSEKLNKWKNALKQAANLSGFHFKHGDGYEYELIDKIVDLVSTKIDSTPYLRVVDHPIGLNYRVLELNWLLNHNTHAATATVGSHGLKLLGIYGMGGIGKTTLARAVFNFISPQFDAFCFLEDVRENSANHGLVHLQQTLLATLAGQKKKKKDFQLASISEGLLLLKNMLHRKKVLLVLDDVNSSDQLQATLGRGLDTFGYGTTIIITTRDKHFLTTHGVHTTYKVEELTKDESLELLSWNAFKTNKIYPDYIDLLNRVTTCASGLPLALEVIGSYLHGKGVKEWESALDSYEKIPSKDIQTILKQTYNALDGDLRQLFLDIACFFKGYELSEVEYLLSAHHGYCFKPHRFRFLLETSLIKIDEHNHVKMHDLIRDMAREIVRQESPDHPGKRSRLWLTTDIVEVLEKNTGTSEIQTIVLDFPRYEKMVRWDGKAFQKMTGLQTLIIRSLCFAEGPKNLPNSLRVLEWWGYPSQSLPSYFYPKKLAVLKLPHSSFMSLELSKSKKFVNMTLLNFDECKIITHIPDVSGAPNLERLSLDSCENLVEIHDSVGFLDKLEILNLGSCAKLRNLPPIHLTSLQHLNLSHCSSLVSFPEILGNMKNITSLSLEYTAIREFPYSIGNLPRLKSLELHGCGNLLLPSSIILLSELEELSIWQCEGLKSYKQDKGPEKVGSTVSSNVKYIEFFSCNISDDFIRIGLSWFSNVVELNLSANTFTVLPTCIKECRFLTILILDYCRQLREIRGIPPNLEIFSAIRCTSLNDLDLTNLLVSTKVCCPLRELVLDDCESLQEIRGIPPSIELLSARNCRSLTISCRRMLLIQELHEAGNKSFCLPGTQMPDWFEHRSKGHSISFWFRGKFPALSLCFVGLMHKIPTGFRPIVIINGNIMKTMLPAEKWFDFEFPVLTDHIFIVGERHIKFEDNMDEVLSENEWNHAVISIDIDFKWSSSGLFAAWIGLHVIKQKCSMDRIQFTNPCNC
ncbi:putative TIR domain, winged helix-turn-helix DNA-binding domain-containing protein [Medicago truncatula]|uniref:Disease resistance protein (TIR-NBS-LRR class) n=2 Tax=Medicago truncatula TaxID=3880 RepID=G7LGU3_MEDTR|nr:disease resistance protein RUN1 isoform X1 [Medicago truncatula]XP_024627430.1 disease resistance protein RUN1 isoform X1 [Medicago truncatula]AET02383.1 disease resistance protein (TIR-NBS-LRR class) [Medicago truncatula]AET02385.1 disease resistance protein (TIR-NBS-LRR class) [Medicago truncatula]RHN40307.1 putative TIR domain, winged helix-turn-helix DNA-binding domain-containing protein [Medicago truncatula]